MTVYEISDLMNGVNSNIIAGQAVFLTMVSAYLLVAYSAGKELTFYQVAYINTIFVLMMFVGYFAQLSQMELVYGYNLEKLALLDQDNPRQDINEVVKLVFISIRVVIALGAIVFMWRVRHPKN